MEDDRRRDLGTQELFRDRGLLMIEDSSSACMVCGVNDIGTNYCIINFFR